jgi:hypothetical protein
VRATFAARGATVPAGYRSPLTSPMRIA